MKFPFSRSRRGFFGHLFGAGATGATILTSPEPSRPTQAWVIVERQWQYNDEYSYDEGEFTRTTLYYDPQQAAADCQRLCEEFFQAQTPMEFEADFESYFTRDYMPEKVTWEELRAEGFPDPYYVQQLGVADVGGSP